MNLLTVEGPPPQLVYAISIGKTIFFSTALFTKNLSLNLTSTMLELIEKYELDQFESSLKESDESVEENKQKLLQKEEYAALTNEEEDWLDHQGNLIKEHRIIAKFLEIKNHGEE
ncbi:hypothetical protein O181_042907 [Austropuccinia psidii MF-1]|uniref:Uncharacterized protein n=1 Tax=Austropuccinia psidii MF-1 TaxID=1389203 RepID=A0A9Q3DNR2_9BASI|nr:hypothetical protein [Austropuccinia psidii MF-1]